MADGKAGIINSYQWDSPSFISHVDIREQTKDKPVIYLYAPDAEKVPHEKLHELREAMAKKGWHTSSDIRHDQSVLRVTGIGNKRDFLTMLNDSGLIQGDPTVASIERDKPKSFVSKIKEHSLRASGLVYTLGNSLYVVSGLKRGKDMGQMGTGIAFAFGDVAVALFGGKDDQRQFKSLMTQLGNHLQKSGVPIPQDTAFAAEISTKGESGGERAYDFMHRNIDKIKAAAEVAGGVAYFKAGHDQKNIWKQITAVIFSLGFGSSVFVKEKKTDPQELKHAGPFKKAWAFVQEAPLRVAGWSGLSNTVLTTVGAFKERQKELALPTSARVNAYPWDFATAGTMLVANNLYAFSHKSAGGQISSGSLTDDVYGLTAQVLNRLPDDKREAGIRAAAEFLGERIELPDYRQQAEAKLREHIVHASQKNPWFIGTGKKASNEADATPALAATSSKAPVTDESWATYVNRASFVDAGQAI